MSIMMRYTVKGCLGRKTDLREFAKMAESSFTSGGFAMDIPIKGKVVTVPFDWDSYSGSTNEDGTMTVTHGEKTLFSTGAEDELDDCHEEEWGKLGISREDLTAKTLANAVAIREFYVDYCPTSEDMEPTQDETLNDHLYLTELCFIDGNGAEYYVADPVLKETGDLLEL